MSIYFKIEIDSSNAVFSEHNNARHEIQRLLLETSRQLALGVDESQEFPLKDFNGNTIGIVEFEYSDDAE